MSLLRTLGLSRTVMFLLLTSLLISIEIGVTYTAAFSRHPVPLSIAVLFDLIFVTTAIFYWLVARPLRLPASRSLLVALLMVRVALFVVPKTAFLPDSIWPYLLMLVEGAVLIMAVLRIQTITRTYRKLRKETDAETALHGSLATVVSKRVAGFMVGEGIVLYYALMGWQLKPDIPPGATPLTTYRQSGQVALTVGLLFVALVEGIVVHLLLTRWSFAAALWISALSAYGMLFFLADLITTIKRPSYLTATHLHLRLGCAGE